MSLLWLWRFVVVEGLCVDFCGEEIDIGWLWMLVLLGGPSSGEGVGMRRKDIAY